jgi:hypothetical protein
MFVLYQQTTNEQLHAQWIFLDVQMVGFYIFIIILFFDELVFNLVH